VLDRQLIDPDDLLPALRCYVHAWLLVIREQARGEADLQSTPEACSLYR
jgi:hypothetical protein